MNSTSKVKKPKFQMGSIRWGLQAQPKIIKKTVEARNQPIETKKTQKSMFSTSKVKRSQKFV
jgi:hypothetical protein